MEMTLRLPSTYADIDRDEMEYINGGWLVPQGLINLTVNMFKFLVGKAITVGLRGIGVQVNNWIVEYAIGELVSMGWIGSALKSAAIYIWSPQGVAMVTAVVFTAGIIGVTIALL